MISRGLKPPNWVATALLSLSYIDGQMKWGLIFQINLVDLTYDRLALAHLLNS